jgi:hypothetical protein
MGSLGVLVALAVAPVHAQEVQWRPAAAPLPAADNGVSLGLPVPAADGKVRTVSLEQPTVRAQSGDVLLGPGIPPPPPPPPNSATAAVVKNPVEAYNCGEKSYCGGPPGGPPGGPAGPGFWDQTRDTIIGIPGAVGGLFQGGTGHAPLQSDHCFDSFCSPVSNPFYFEDPRALTEVRPLLIFQRVPGANPYFQGGDIWFYGVQGRLAINDVFSVVINKLGAVTLQPHSQTHGITNDTGFAELSLGPKFTFFRNESSRTVMAAGLNFDMAIGSGGVFQNTGDLSLVPYFSIAQGFGKSSYGSFNFMNTTGYSFATDNQRNDFFFSSFHLDYDVANLNKIFPLIELNWFAFTQNGGSNKFFGFEGRDLVNFGTGGIAGHQDLSLALGARYKFAEWFQIGAVVEFPLVSRDKGLMDYRLGFDLIFRY